MMSLMSSTLLMVASIPVSLTTSSTAFARALHLGHPVPNTLISIFFRFLYTGSYFANVRTNKTKVFRIQKYYSVFLVGCQVGSFVWSKAGEVTVTVTVTVTVEVAGA